MKNTKIPSTLNGEVVDYQHGYYRIDCETDIEHLKIHFLTQSLVNPHRIEIGDSVILEYRLGSNYGHWFVKEVGR